MPPRTTRAAATLIAGLLIATSACGDDDTTADSPAAGSTSDASVAAGTTAEGTEATSSEPADGDVVTLDWWLVTQNDTQKEALTEMLAAFEAANPTIKINLEERDIDAHKDALRRSAGTDAEPDLYFMWTGLGLGGEFVNAGVSADLTSYYEQYKWEDRFVAPALSSVAQYGGFHGVPWSQRGEVVFYRTDLFEQAGIDAEPTTYDELVAVNDQLMAAGITPFEFGGTVNWHVMRLLDVILESQCGAETHDALKALEASWATEPCVADSFAELKTWSDDYLNDGFIGIDSDEASQLLYAGQAAMAIEGDWFNGAIAANSDKSLYGLFPFPTGTGRLYGFTEAMYFGESSEHKDEAAVFMDFVTSTEVQAKYFEQFGSLSVNKEVAPSSPIRSTPSGSTSSPERKGCTSTATRHSRWTTRPSTGGSRTQLRSATSLPMPPAASSRRSSTTTADFGGRASEPEGWSGCWSRPTYAPGGCGVGGRFEPAVVSRRPSHSSFRSLCSTGCSFSTRSSVPSGSASSNGTGSPPLRRAGSVWTTTVESSRPTLCFGQPSETVLCGWSCRY